MRIIAYVLGGIAGAVGTYFGGWPGLCAVIFGEISMVLLSLEKN